MIGEDIQECDDFLTFIAGPAELLFAEKIVLLLMALYVSWTISLYRVYKVVGAQ